MPLEDGALAQRSFTGGEVTPAMYSRVDQQKYQQGLKTARNGYVMRQGGFTNRPGTAMVATTGNGTNKVRLIPFVFSNSVSYVLEFGNQYMRVYKAGAQIQSGGNPYQITAPYATADLPNIQFVQSENVMYMACAGYQVQKLTCTGDTSWTFATLNYVPTTAVPQVPTAVMSYASPPSGYMLYATLGGSVSVGGGISWSLPWNILPSAGATMVPATAGRPGPPEILTEYYAITAIDQLTGIESLPMPGQVASWVCDSVTGLSYYNPASLHSNANTSAITAIHAENPFRITVASAAYFTTGDLFTISGTGNPVVDGLTLPAFVSGNDLIFDGLDGTSFSTSVAGSIACTTNVCYGAVKHSVGYGLYGYSGTFYNNTWNEGPLTLTWNPPATSGNYKYNVYKKASNGLWGFMGTVAGNGAGPFTYIDDGSTLPDTSKGLPTYHNNFIGAGGFPSVIGIYQQRLCLANTPSQQEWLFASNTGNYEQFTSETPTVDTDTVQFQISGKKFNPVSQIIDNGNLLIFTDSGEFSCLGDASGALTPTGINLRQQAFYGGSKLLQPIVVGKNVLYLQTRQSKVRELLYNYYINGYSGSDVTIFSNHLFDNHTFTAWCYQQEPNSIVWMVRDDGILLSLTYIPEQQLLAWARHDTLGTFEDVCSVPEGNEDALYCVVNRTINGSAVRFVERFASRQISLVQELQYIGEGENVNKTVLKWIPDVPRSVFMDCSTYYDGRNTDLTLTMTPVNGDFTANGVGFRLNCSNGSYFTPSSTGAIILYDPADGSPYRCKILGTNSGVYSWALCRPDLDLPDSLIGVATSNWALGVKAVSGLTYLEGQNVSVLADGAVISSPSEANTTLTVSGGEITLPNYYAYIRVGLPYVTDMRSLDFDTPAQGQTAQDKEQLTNKVALYVQDTRGIWVGLNPPTNDALNPLEKLRSMSPRNFESLGDTPDTKTGIIWAAVDAKFQYGGGIFVRQVDPLPMTVLAMVPAGKFALGQ